MFDRTKLKTVAILSGTRKLCTVRFPTDEEWATRSRGIKMVRQQIGRGKTKPVAQGKEKIDAVLFAAICVDPGERAAFDDSEASQVIEAIEACKVLEVELAAGSAKFVLQIGSVETTHELRFPTAADKLKYERASVSRIDGGRFTEIRFAIEPAGQLYDQLLVSVGGYAGAAPGCVPINHKFAIVYELMEEIERAMEEFDSPEA